jgi:hypothetical protein
MERWWVNRGGVMNTKIVWVVGGGLGLDGPLPDVFRLTVAVVHLVLNYIFAEISKNGLGSIPLKVPIAPCQLDYCKV